MTIIKNISSINNYNQPQQKIVKNNINNETLIANQSNNKVAVNFGVLITITDENKGMCSVQ